MEVINCKIDVSKITKAKLFKGEKGLYLNCTLIPTPNSQYGDFMLVEDTTKEEREAGTKGVILGNGKKFQRGEGGEPKSTDTAKIAEKEDDFSDLPF